MYGTMPSYTLDAGLEGLRDLGVSDFEASMVSTDDGAEARTLEYLESRLQRLGGARNVPRSD